MRKRGAVYSSSRRMPLVEKPVAAEKPLPVEKPAAPKLPVKKARRSRWAVPAAVAAVLATLVAFFLVPSAPPPEVVAEEPPQREMTSADAYEKIRGSVVMVRGSPYDGTEEVETKGP